MIKRIMLMIALVFFLAGCSETQEENTLLSGKVMGTVEMQEMRVSRGVTRSELSRHNVPSDCWVEYDGYVYDITHLFGIKATGAEMNTTHEDIDELKSVCGEQERMLGYKLPYRMQRMISMEGYLRGMLDKH
ncbi:MAG: cytochrome b5 domain-containing protein [Nanoarchaeota archaeon]